MFRVTRVWLVLSAMGFLAACGGGYGDSVQDDSRRISGVAQLGYIQSGIVELYEVSDLVNPLAVAETSNSVSGADLGAFSISLPAGLSSPMYVIKVSGGTDLDPDDNGEIDISAGVKNRGSFYGLIPSENLDGTVRVTALSDLIYRSTPKQNLGDGATASGIAEKLLNDLDGDGRVDLGDVLAFDPLRHVDQLKVSYDDLLKAYVGLIHRGDQQSGLAKRALEFVDYEPEPPGPLYAEVGAVITFPEQALPRGLVTEWTMDDQVVTGGATLSRVGSTSIALEIKHGEHRVAQYFWDAVAYEASELGHVDADPGSVSLLDVTNEQSDSLAGFELLVPAGAVDKPVTIVASELESDGKAVLGVPLSKAIELLPAGTQFAKPVLVSMPFRPEGVNSSDVIVTRVNDDGSVDSLVPESVDIDRGLVSFRTEHFSKYQINKDVQNNFDNLTSFAYDESQVESFVSELLILLEGAPDVSYDSDDLQPYREMSAEEWLRLLSVNLQTVKVRDASNKDLLVFDIVKSAIQQKNIKRYFSQRRYQRAFEELYAEGELPAFGVLKTWGWAKEAIGSPVETLSRTMIGDDATDALLLMKRMNDFGEVVSDPLGAVEDQVGSWTTDASVANKLASKYLDVVLDLGTTVVSGYHDIWVNAQIGQYVDYRRGNNVDAGYELYRYLSGSGPLPTHDWELLAGDVKWFASSVPDDEDPPPQFWRMVEGLYQESVKQDDLDGLKKVLDAALPISKGQDVEADGPHRIDVSVFVENHNVLYGDPAEVCGGEKYDVELRLGAQGFRFLDDKLDPQNVNLSYEFEDVSADKSFYKSAEACALSERNSRATCLIPDVEIPEVTTSRRLPVDFRTSYRADYVSAHGNKYSVNKILEETHLPDFVIRPTGQLTYYVEGFEVGRRIGHDNTVYHDFGGDLEFGLGDKPLTAVDGISADLLVNGKRYELDVSPSGRFSESVVADEVHSAQLELSVPRYQGASCYRLSEEDKTVDLSVAELLAEQESEETTEGTKLGLYFTNSALSHHDDARRTVASGDMVNFWFPLSGEDSVEEAEDAYELYFDSDPYGGLTRLHPNAKFTEDSNGNVGVAFSYQYSQADYYRARVRPKKNGKFILVDGQPTTYYSPILVVESQTTINQAPTARAVVVGGQSQFSAGETFTLSAEGSTDPENDHLEYTWYYLADDRAAWLGRGVEFTHRTQVVGEHRFRVKAVDSNGNADFAEITLVVVESENSPPIAKINAPTSVEEDQGFAITTDGSSDSDGCIVGYHVTWGDGGVSRLPPADICFSEVISWSHEYKAAGVYTIRLTATDDDGATDTAAATITVTETDDPEQVSVTSVSPTSAAAGQVVKYHVNGTNFPETVTAHIQNASYCGNKQRVSSELFTMDCMHRRTGSLEMTVKAQSGGELLAGGSVNIGFTPSQAEGFHYPVGLDEQTGERADFSGSQPVALAEQISPEQNNLYGANDVADNAKRGKPNSDNNLWRNAQDVGSFLELPGTEGVHPGEDWNQGSGDSDAGQPVTAIANGKVVRLANKGNLAWLMVLEHPQVGGDSVYSFYLHITGKQLTDGQMTSSVSSFGLQVGDWVSEKEVIGRLANMRGQNGSGLYAHLHFEIRTKYDPDLGDDWPGDNGNGYYTDGTIVVKKSSMTGDEIKRAHEVMSAVGFVDPSDFIDARRTPEASVAAIIADLQPREVVVDEQVTLTVTGSNIQQVSDVQPSAGNCSAARQTGFNEFELTCVFDNVGQTPVRVVVEGNDGKFVERSFDVAVNEADPVEGFSRDELRNRTLYRVYKENNRDWHLDRIIFGDDHYHYAPGITGPASFGPESYDIARDGSLVLVNATPGNPDGYTDVNVYPVKRADSYIEVCWDYGSDALFCALIYEDNGGDQGTERLYASSDAAKAFCEAQGGCVGADADEAGNLENGEATLRWQYNVDNETLDIDLLSTSFRNCGPNSVSESDALVLVTELSNTRMHWRHADGGIDQWSGSGTSSVNPAGTWYQSLADGSEYSLALSDNGSGSKPNGTGTLSGKCLPSNESGNREVDGLVQGLITAVTGSIATDLRIRLVTRDNVLQDSFNGLNCPISSSSGRFSDACLLGTNEEEFSASSGHHYQVVVYRDGNGDGRWNRGEETADCELQAGTSGLDDYHQYGAWEQVDCYFDGRPEGGSDSGAGSGDPSGKRVTQGGINSPQPFSVGNTSCKAGVSQDVLSVVSDFQKYANAYARIGNDTTVIFNLDYPANSANSGASVQLGIVGNDTTDILYRTNYSSLSPSGGIKLARDVSAPYVGRYDLAVAVAEANDEDSGCVLRSTGYIEVVE